MRNSQGTDLRPQTIAASSRGISQILDAIRSHGYRKIDTLFSMGRYIYRAWITNLPLTPTGIWHFYDGRAGMEPRIRELREDFALRKIPTYRIQLGRTPPS
jgi:hypothetical protein